MRTRHLPLLFLAPLVSSNVTRTPTVKDQHEVEAGFRAGMQFIRDGLDKGIRRFYLYAGADSGLNHFYPSLWLNGPDSLSMDTNHRDKAGMGSSYIRVTWKDTPGLDKTSWNGIIWHNSDSWHGTLGPPYDLSGATKITGRIRSMSPGLQVSLFFGGNPVSTPKTYAKLEGEEDTSAYVEPKVGRWQSFEIDLSGRRGELKAVSSAFGFTTSDQHTISGGPAVFDLADISFDLVRPATTGRLLPSYGMHAEAGPDLTIDPSMFAAAEPPTRNVAYVYDEALAILCLMLGNSDDLVRARALADGLCYAAENHRSFEYRRYPKMRDLTNGLMAGDAEQYSGGSLNAKGHLAARVSGWYDPGEPIESKRWKEDLRQASTNVGDLAWAMIALTALYDRTQENRYLNTAVGLGLWVREFCKLKTGDGYAGGMEGWKEQYPATYASTEMNIDLIAAFHLLSKATGDAQWDNDMRSARRFALSMYSKAEGHFLAGESFNPSDLSRKPEINDKQHPLDVNSWALLVLGKTPETESAFHWAETHCKVVTKPAGIEGFSFGDACTTGVWAEGTGQMIACYRLLGDQQNTVKYANSLLRIQRASPAGTGIVASTQDGLWTGFDYSFIDSTGSLAHAPWNYHAQAHVGATAWMLFAFSDYNPYYQIHASSQPEKLPK